MNLKVARFISHYGPDSVEEEGQEENGSGRRKRYESYNEPAYKAINCIFLLSATKFWALLFATSDLL